jgi:hypothetical protein
MKKVFSSLAVFAVCSFNMVTVDEALASFAEAEIGFNYEVITNLLDCDSVPMVIWDENVSGNYQLQIDGYDSYGYFNPNQNTSTSILSDGKTATIIIADGVSIIGFEAKSLVNYAYMRTQMSRGFHVEGDGLLVLTTTGSATCGFDGVWDNAFAGFGIYDNSGDGIYSSDSSSIKARIGYDFKPQDLSLSFLVEAGHRYMVTSYNSVSVNRPIESVPVPEAVWLMGTGFICLIGLKRKKLS